MIDVKPLLENSTVFREQKFARPTCAFSVDRLREIDELNSFLYKEGYCYPIFGSDICGGFAYVGNKQDIDKVQELCNQYLQIRSNAPQYDAIFYIRWDVGSDALLIMYEQYYFHNPKIPEFENVFRTNFGAHVDDMPLLEMMLNLDKYEPEAYLGSEEFDINKHSGMYLRVCDVLSVVSNQNISQEV